VQLTFKDTSSLDNVTHISHRGGPRDSADREMITFPENTLAAFKNADKLTDMFELDVQLTLDEQVFP
jgi:glycerophosphoryl diester phosphodiesterase